MGGRLSKPRSADGMSELPKALSGAASARPPRSNRIINGRTLMAPLAALTMASILFVYTRTSIRAAKLNAQKHREADGGQMNWYQESRRQHGHADKVENSGATFREALAADMTSRKATARRKDKEDAAETTGKLERSAGEQALRKVMGKDD